MIGFKLGNSMIECPVVWFNFIQHLQSKHNNQWYDVSVNTIQKELKQYDGRYRLSGSEKTHRIEFQTEAGYTLFVLQWS